MAQTTFGRMFGVALLILSCSTGGAMQGDGGASNGDGTGGAEGNTACGSVAPCEGNVLGTWQVSQSCLTLTEDLSSACSGASATVEFTFGGTMTFASDQTYSAARTGSTTTHYHYPAACVPASYTCSQYGQIVKAVGSYASVDCTADSGGLCNCDAVTNSSATNEIGSYVISGSTLTISLSGMTSSSPYCVQGNTMYLMQAVGDGGAQTSGSIVLVR